MAIAGGWSPASRMQTPDALVPVIVSLVVIAQPSGDFRRLSILALHYKTGCAASGAWLITVVTSCVISPNSF
jgi:hypothetical protein